MIWHSHLIQTYSKIKLQNDAKTFKDTVLFDVLLVYFTMPAISTRSVISFSPHLETQTALSSIWVSKGMVARMCGTNNLSLLCLIMNNSYRIWSCCQGYFKLYHQEQWLTFAELLDFDSPVERQKFGFIEGFRMLYVWECESVDILSADCGGVHNLWSHSE